MKIKRIVAPSVREAMNKVRQEQGPDAVILANKKVEGGVEIISATDYDIDALETMADPSEAGDSAQTQSPQTASAYLQLEDDPPTQISYQAVARAQQQGKQAVLDAAARDKAASAASEASVRASIARAKLNSRHGGGSRRQRVAATGDEEQQRDEEAAAGRETRHRRSTRACDRRSRPT